MDSREQPQTDPASDDDSLLQSRSLLGLLFAAEEIASLMRTYPPRVLSEGETAFGENDPPRELLIVLEGRLHLHYARPGESPLENGILLPGRSANLYAVMKGLPYQYSGIARETTRILALPRDLVMARIAERGETARYLERIFEHQACRAISKEMEELGLSNEFRIEFVGGIEERKIPAQSWIVRQDGPVPYAFMVVSGHVNSYQKRSDSRIASLSQVPGRAWIGWREALEERSFTRSFRSSSAVSVLAMDADRLRELRNRFGADFAQYSEWTLQASLGSLQPEPDGVRADVDPESLFPREPARRPAKWFGRWSYPWVPQENEMDCGPACLAMLAKFHGNEIPVQFWRSRVFTNREGTSLFDLSRGAERNGFTTHGLYVDDLADLDSRSLPCIAARNYHFVVIYAVRGGVVTFGDPALGIRRLPLEEFHRGYENAVLLAFPNEDFRRIATPPSQYHHYLRLLQGHGKELGLVAGCAAIYVLFSLIPPFLMQVIMDEVIVAKDERLLVFALGLVATITVLQTAIGWLRSYYINYLSLKFDFRASSAFLRKTFSLPYSFFALRHVGDFSRRLSEMERLRDFVTQTALGLFLDFLTLGIYGVVLYTYSPLIATLTLLLAPPLVGLSMLFSRKLQTSYLEAFNSRSEQEGLLTDLIRGAPVVKSLAAEVAARWRLEERVVNTLRARHSFALLSTSLNSISDLYGALVRLGLMGVAASLGIEGRLSPGQVVSISIFVNYVISPFFSLAHAWSGFQELKSALTRLNDVFLAPSEGTGKKAVVAKAKLRGEIEFQDVWFRFGGEASDWALKGVSFRVEPGQRIAIVGPSGSGKSTIAHLLLRLHEPTRGQILVDGRDYRDYDLAWYRAQLGLILQDSQLFSGSIGENIGFADAICDEARVQESARLAGADDFIARKPGAYSYLIAHGGFGLSGGEKQRIACARAFYGDPAILILDEATSALDGVSERRLLDELIGRSGNRTALSIAHRYSTARYFEQVLLLNAGRIVGFGSHDHLRASSDLYRSLFGLREGEAA